MNGTIAIPTKRKVVVRYGGYAVRFVRNATGLQYDLVGDGEATPFDNDAQANQAIGKWHLDGRAYTDTLTS